jgi:hypothetical protein
MELGSVIAAAKGAKDLAEFARKSASSKRQNYQRREIQELIEALRMIYFSPRGVITLLNQISDGSQPSEEQIAMILPEFNDYEFRVHRMLSRIAPEHGEVRGRLTLRAQRVLREISYGKQGIRGKVKGLLNEALTVGRPVSRADATKLRDEIVELNTAIENAEEALAASIR